MVVSSGAGGGMLCWSCGRTVRVRQAVPEAEGEAELLAPDEDRRPPPLACASMVTNSCTCHFNLKHVCGTTSQYTHESNDESR